MARRSARCDGDGRHSAHTREEAFRPIWNIAYRSSSAHWRFRQVRARCRASWRASALATQSCWPSWLDTANPSKTRGDNGCPATMDSLSPPAICERSEARDMCCECAGAQERFASVRMGWPSEACFANANFWPQSLWRRHENSARTRHLQVDVLSKSVGYALARKWHATCVAGWRPGGGGGTGRFIPTRQPHGHKSEQACATK